MAHQPKTRMDIPGRREAHERQKQQNAERQRKLDELQAKQQRPKQQPPAKPEPKPDVLHPVSEAAKQLSISVATLRSWINQRLVQAVRYPTGMLRVPQSSIDSLKASLNFYKQQENARRSGEGGEA